MKHQPLYREVLRQAWQLTWRHKILWAIGLFAAFLGTGGAFEILARHLDLVFNPRLCFAGVCQRFWLVGGQFDLVSSLWAVALVLLLLGLAAFFVFLVIGSFNILILAADRFRKEKKIDWPRWRRESRRKFWPVLGLAVFFKFLIAVFSLFGVWPLWLVFQNQAGAWLLVLYPLIFLVSLSAVLVCAFLLVYAAALVVLENYSWWPAVIGSWRLFIRHWLVNLEMAAVIFLINLAVSLLMLFGGLILALPFAAVFFFSVITQFLPLGRVAAVLGLLAVLLFILWLVSVLAVFYVSAWTLLFRRMQEGRAVSKLIRWFGHLKFKR